MGAVGAKGFHTCPTGREKLYCAAATADARAGSLKPNEVKDIFYVHKTL
jgi:hypothetical protein